MAVFMGGHARSTIQVGVEDSPEVPRVLVHADMRSRQTRRASPSSCIRVIAHLRTVLGDGRRRECPWQPERSIAAVKQEDTNRKYQIHCIALWSACVLAISQR